jgi:type I restriction enzyme S subunit
VKEKKLRADKPITPLLETEVPYEVPEGWAWCRLGEVIDTLKNGISEAPNASSGTAILRISSLRPNAVNLNDIRFLPKPISAYESYSLEANDLLFTRYSGNSDFVGICGVVPPIRRETVYPDKLMRAKLLGGLLPEFVSFAINTGSSRAFIAELLKTTAGQVGIAGTQLKNTPFPLPPLLEQRRIVAKVTELLAYCTGLDTELVRARQAAEALHAAALREAFTRSSDLAELV